MGALHRENVVRARCYVLPLQGDMLSIPVRTLKEVKPGRLSRTFPHNNDSFKFFSGLWERGVTLGVSKYHEVFESGETSY